MMTRGVFGRLIAALILIVAATIVYMVLFRYPYVRHITEQIIIPSAPMEPPLPGYINQAREESINTRIKAPEIPDH